MDALNILIIEDVPDDAALVELSLKRSGILGNWHRVENELELRTALAARSFDLVISDFRMPAFSGIDALNIFREFELDIPFIVISGTIGEDVAVEAMRLGVNDYLMKGSLARLAPAVRRELKEAASRREKRLAQQALRESEERYRIVAETASDAILTIDSESRILYVNTAAEKIFGYSRSEIIGSPLTLLMPERMRQKHNSSLSEYIKTGKRKLDWSGFEITARRKDGEIITVHISFGEFKNASRHLFTAIVRDITANKAAEIALRRSEEDFRALVEATTQFVWKMDATGRLTEFPHWWVGLTGQSSEESLDYGWTEYIHPEDRQLVRDVYETGLISRKPINVNLRIRTKDNEYRHYEARGVPIFSQDGSFVQWICALVDVTDRARAVAELQESEENFRALVQATTQFVWTSGKDEASPELLVWFSEILGMQFQSDDEIISRLHTDDREEVLGEWKLAFQTRSLFDRVCRFLKSDMSIKYLAVRAVPICTRNGEFRYWIGTFTDISERMAAQEALRQNEMQLRTIVESVPECIKLLDLNGNLMKMNPSGMRMLGCDSFDLIQNKQVVDLVSEEHKQEFQKCIDRVASGEQSELQFEIINFNGDRRWMDMKAVPIRDAHDVVVAVLGVTRDESERRSSVQALRKSEEKFRELFENANDLVYTHDLNGKYTSLNRAGELITGYNREEIDKLNIREIVAPEYLDVSLKMLSDKLKGETRSTSYEVAIISKEGRRVMLDLGTRLIYEDGKPVGIQGIARDITEKKLAENALRASENQLRVITDTVPVYISYVGADLRFRFANRAFLDWLGKPSAEVVGNELSKVLGEDIVEKIRPEIDQVLSGKSFTIERDLFMNVHPLTSEKRIRFARLNYVPEFDENGKVVAFFTFTTDLTQNKLAEEALRKSESQLRIITNTVPVLIAYFDTNRICRYANDSYAEWFGRSLDETIDTSILALLGDSKYEQMSHEFDRVLNGEEFTFERKTLTVRSSDPIDMYRYMRISYVPERGANGDITGFYFFAIDLTDAKRAELALRKSEEQLIQAQKLESIGRLAGGIAHDFNNMLTAINGYSELTLRRMHLGDPLRHNLEEIRKAGERSAELTNQLLAFSRKQIMQPRLLDINKSLGDLMPMLERLIGEDVQLRTSFARNTGSVKVDPGQLSQVVLNLVVNARDSMPTGGTITIETGRAELSEGTDQTGLQIAGGTYSYIAIVDSGIGMDEQTVRHIFEPFFTTKEVGKGTGLGLSTVHGIVVQSGGHLKVQSALNMGSRFEVFLPAEANQKAPSEVDENGSSYFVGTETILLVEDEETVRDLGREVLESCGYTVLIARDGTDALDVLQKKGDQIALMMTDVVMPKMGGYELAENTAKQFPHVKILFSSGYDDNAIVQQGVLREGTNFIQKPFSFDALALKIRELLDQK